LGVPVIGIGLLYQQGYFRQQIDANGNQHALYPFNDPGQLPITPLRDAKGDWLRLALRFPAFTMWVRGWEVMVGGRKLYLLDTNDPANQPELRSIAGELYGGNSETRLQQEMVLGIGGWRLLQALGIHPEVCHLNEGHAAFAVLDRAASYADATGNPFSSALATTRAGNLFTTHTPVAAGFDRFAPDLMRTYFNWYAQQRLKISIDDLLALGRQNPGDCSEPFNMANLAMRGCGAVNGVSKLHGEVSRRLFQPLFPGWPTAEVPVQHVTNGVHVASWDSAQADRLWTDHCGEDCWRGDMKGIPECFGKASDGELWKMRNESRRDLVDYVRVRYARQMAARGAGVSEVAEAGRIFDPGVLTLGFARRFATYKRPDLLLHDPERLSRILTNPHAPVQLILAGKAHPQDEPGKQIIRRWHDFIRRFDGRPNVIFLSDYDMLLTERLVGGVDVWLNTPRRPWEASGTSGMKVLVNGGLNVSELDGWWAEAYSSEVGWAIGDGHEHGEDPAWDAAEAEALYALLERDLIPEFYRRDASGISAGWLAKMRHSMSSLTPQFSANRTVREYTEKHYLPAAAAYTARSAAGGRVGSDIAAWSSTIATNWHAVHFGEFHVSTHEGMTWFEVALYLGGIHPDSVCVELYADGLDGAAAFRQPMEQRGPRPDGGLIFGAAVPADRNPADYTPRVYPFHSEAFVPLEANQICWQK
jgi:starch phosphorylase